MVFLVPKQRVVPAMWLDMIDLCGKGCSSLALACCAPRVLCKKRFPIPPPPCRVVPRMIRRTLFVVRRVCLCFLRRKICLPLRFVLRAVSFRTKHTAHRICARTQELLRHSYHLFIAAGQTKKPSLKAKDFYIGSSIPPTRTGQQLFARFSPGNVSIGNIPLCHISTLFGVLYIIFLVARCLLFGNVYIFGV